jgi:hypothetical protein
LDEKQLAQESPSVSDHRDMTWPDRSDFEADGPGAATAEEAARGDIPAEHSPALFVDYDPSGAFATVLLNTGSEEDPCPYEEFCYRIDGRWYGNGGSNGSTQYVVRGAFSLFTDWGEAPPGVAVVCLEFQGQTYECPVKNGYYRLTVWDWDEQLYNAHLDRLTSLHLMQAKVIDDGDGARVELDPSQLTAEDRAFWDQHATEAFPQVVGTR